MTLRAQLHTLLDELPEERLEGVREALEQLADDGELTPDEQSAVAEGVRDVQAGRTVSLEDYRKQRNL